MAIIAQLRRSTPYILLALGVSIGVFAIWQQSYSKPHLPKSPTHPVATLSSKRPAPSAVDSYTVAPDAPRYLQIPQIGVKKTRVIGLGADTGGHIAVPDNLFDVGWYNDSGKPGKAGAMFMYGHVSGWQANGVFYNLYKLKPGDTVVVTRGDNTVFTFEVVATKRYSVTHIDMQAALSPITPGREGLNLMTCAGSLDHDTGEFSERLVVFTRLAK